MEDDSNGGEDYQDNNIQQNQKIFDFKQRQMV